MQRVGSEHLNRLACLTALMGLFAGCMSPMPPAGAEDDPVDVGLTTGAIKAELNFRISNVARGKTATQSSTYGGAAASRAIDGNTNGNFNAGSVTHTNPDANAYWQVDLGQKFFVVSVDVFNRTDCCNTRLANAKVQLIGDGGAVVMEKALTSSTEKQTISFLPGRSVRYVKISAPGQYLSLAEVQVNAPETYLDTEDDVCWMKTYGRGVGTIPDSCPGQQKDGALCYPYCANGYYGVGPVCWQYCPAGYTDDGALCRKDASIISADNSSCPWYDTCGLTFSKGCSRCPAGYSNDGCTCRRDAHIFAKSSYGRTAGNVMSCNASQENDAGLCYPQCGAGYDGVGPVCWGNCSGSYPVSCGAGCAKTQEACGEALAEQISAPFEAVANIAALVLSFGTSAAVQVPAKIALTAAEKTVLKTTLKATIKTTAKEIAKELGEAALEGLAEETATQLVEAQAQMSAGSGASIDLLSLATSLDPTGLAAVGVAFAKPICK